MTRLMMTTALALAVAAPAAAQSEMLRDAVEDYIDATVQDVDVDTLTDEQVRALYAGLSSESSAAERNALIESIVRDSQYRMEDNIATFEAMDYGASTDLRSAVGLLLSGEGIDDVNVEELDNNQIAALYLELTDGGGADATDIEAILQ